MKAQILIVEDEALLYDHIRKQLVRENYTVDDYTPSVTEALKHIKNKRPDLVLLDIRLQGEETGLDLGELLQKDFKIPFIYLTQLGDNETFYSGLNTNHDDFIVKKNLKLDTNILIRRVQTVLNRHNNKPKKLGSKEAIIVYTDYLQKIKDLGHEDISQHVLPYNEIAFFSTNSEEAIYINPKTKKTKYKKMEPNNVRVETFKKRSEKGETLKGTSYIVPNSLSAIESVLPNYFVRISNDYIVNIHYAHLAGRINDRRLIVDDKIFVISEGSFKTAFEKRYKELYQSVKKGDFH